MMRRRFSFRCSPDIVHTMKFLVDLHSSFSISLDCQDAVWWSLKVADDQHLSPSPCGKWDFFCPPLSSRVTNNLPFRSHTMTPQDCFQTFIRAIFYVGKGKRSRPYSHLYEALEYHRGEKTSKVKSHAALLCVFVTLPFGRITLSVMRPFLAVCQKLCPKVQHILQIWAAGQGVVSLHCFQNVIPVEAYTREACMVEAIGEYSSSAWRAAPPAIK